jgi:hypothetical protein
MSAPLFFRSAFYVVPTVRVVCLAGGASARA